MNYKVANLEDAVLGVLSDNPTRVYSTKQVANFACRRLLDLRDRRPPSDKIVSQVRRLLTALERRGEVNRGRKGARGPYRWSIRTAEQKEVDERRAAAASRKKALCTRLREEFEVEARPGRLDYIEIDVDDLETIVQDLHQYC